MRVRSLGHLLDEARLASSESVPDRAVTGITHDSRAVSRGSIFCAVRGARFDGHEFAATAVEAGAVAIVVDRSLPGIDASVPQIVVDDVRLAMGRLSTAFWGDPSSALELIGITGTNGKTTTAHLIASISRSRGRSTEIIGTLSGGFTTPEAPDLQASLAAMRERGVTSVAMEVSSHSLVMQRVAGTRFAAAVFTNLSRDHLDLHGDMENYFAAKARLFDPEYTDLAIVNADDAYGRRLSERARVETVPYRRSDLADVRVSTAAHSFTWRGRTMSVPLGGAVNVENSLAAATTMHALGVDLDVIAEGLASVPAVPGRMERVDVGQEFTVFVDYAHTPDGLSAVLRSLRESAVEGRIILVFGCGGDRDKAKRPLMGEVAVNLADEVVVTSDNPRSEDPGAIIASIVAGVPDHLRHRLVDVEEDRRRAIGKAISRARPGDVVLVAGKGHETTQTVGDLVLPFDDRLVVREALGVDA